MNYQVIADSGCDIPKKLAEKYNIWVLPLVIIEGDKEYFDQETITEKEIYKNMKNEVVYSTSQVPFQRYYDAFKLAIAQGKEVISISISSGISGCYTTSAMARGKIVQEYPDAKIHLWDSKGASFGAGITIVRIAKMVADGCSLEELEEAMNFYVENADHIFTVSNMEYLYRGGRISKAQFYLGGMLNIKPILTMSKPDGKLEALAKVRGDKQLNKKIIETMIGRSKGNKFNKDQTVAVFHADFPDEADKLRSILKKELGVAEVLVSEIGGTIGCHVGPGTLAVLFLRDLYKNHNILGDELS